MGMTKAIAEKILLARAGTVNKKSTILCITRYGNVMGSRASVIPRFINLANKNSPLTVTDIRMSRFMMSLDSSVNLVFHALINGKQGDTFVQKSPACKIIDLAKAIEIQPLPVPISKAELNLSCNTHLTNSSVSGLGINTLLLTLNSKFIKAALPKTY